MLWDKGIAASLGEGVFSFKKDGIGVLHCAASAGHLEVCKYLVEELGGDVNMTAAKGLTPLMSAAQSGDVSTVKYLLDRGGDIMKADENGRTVLHHAACTGSTKVTEFLLSKGIPVDMDYGCGTALVQAASNDQDKTVKILLDHHANPNATFSGLCTPLMGALLYHSLKCMKLLIKAGGDVNGKGCYVTPLVMATIRGGYTDEIRLLLKAGADANIPDDVYFYIYFLDVLLILGMAAGRIRSGYPRISGLRVLGLVPNFRPRICGFGYPLSFGFGSDSIFHPRTSIGAPKRPIRSP
ncbi:hypothetical protein HU200_033343 [Digitaria exilis]|uniref:Uncharacterized protein n=1 Tax=Digitaria exilis TaxID=1010633 RepID=A0A835BVN3_9POAL|nr:hypothetical protein HU200_033343 [Digitaria exilis]